ncbi:MAG: DM13 domain-containing protein [Cyanobacteria bacterium J06638_6]
MKWSNLSKIAAVALVTGMVASCNSSPTVEVEETPSAQPEAVADPSATEPPTTEAVAGQFVTVEQEKATTGTASIVTADNGDNYLEFDAAFSTATGPDVTVVLYNAPVVPVNLDEADYVTLAPLESFEGAQSYIIPAEIDLSNFEAVGIWCREFNVTFGYAPL